MLKLSFFTGTRQKSLLLAAFITFFVQCLLTSAYLVVFLLLIATLTGSITYSVLAVYAAILVGIVASYYAASAVSYSFSMGTGYSIVADLRSRMADHLRRLPLAFFKRTAQAKVSGCFLHDMMDAESVFCVYLHEVAAYIFLVVLSGVVLFAMDSTMGMLLLTTLVVAAPVLLAAWRTTGSHSSAYLEARSLVDGTLQEYLGGISELKASNLTGARYKPWSLANARFRKLALSLETKMGVLCQIYFTILDYSFIALLFVGSWLVTQGRAELPVLIFFLLISGRFYEPLQSLGIFLAQFRFSAEALKRIGSVLEEPVLPQKAGFTPPSGYSIAFDKVSFSYGDKRILQSVSFTAAEGAVTALVGASGAGKTTIANLLLRFWDVHEGSIHIGGTDIRSFTQEDFYRLFSVVFQDAYLFNDTIMNNIKMARPDASPEEVAHSAEQAGCAEFITRFPEGINTIVGEKGSRLSGGERQRIAIARAILKNAPILILDEATASIDPENELVIQRALSSLVCGKTLLVIAHRLATIQKAEQILVLKDGRITEHGRHEELLSKKGIYRTFWDCQERMKGWSVR